MVPLLVLIDQLFVEAWSVKAKRMMLEKLLVLIDQLFVEA